VYRTSGKNKKYFILPANQFEAVLSEVEPNTDQSILALPLADKKAFQLFLDDSRKLFKSHNLNIEEEPIIHNLQR
jgi:hypothetical protein